MNDHPASAEKVPRPARGNEPNRYAITLAALLASAEIPEADQIAEQPAAPPHDYSSGFDTTGNDGEYMICLKADDGARVWDVKVGPKNGGGGYPGPRSTPTIDHGFAYAVA